MPEACVEEQLVGVAIDGAAITGDERCRDAPASSWHEALDLRRKIRAHRGEMQTLAIEP